MDDDLDLRNFSGLTRLFPLPGVVLFPHAVLPLHIFEPRYRQMTEDALANDHLVTIVQLRPTGSGTLGSPPIEEVGCLGRILQHERLPDGRYNFLLLGRKRVRLHREVPSDKLYRIAEVEILDDVDDERSREPDRAALILLFRRAFTQRSQLDPDLAAILKSSLPLGVLTDIIAHAMALSTEVKQHLLANPRIDDRAAFLIGVLEKVLKSDAGTVLEAPPYPPPFSVN